MIMGDMASYYTNDGLGTDEEIEAEMADKVELRIFVICYDNGNFHSMNSNYDIARSTARRIGGIIGELTNVHRPEVAPIEVAQKIIDALENPTARVTRSRRLRSDIDGGPSDAPLDQPNAA
jgi:hypothetical protein